MDSCFLHTFINYRVPFIPNEINRKVRRLQFEAGDDYIPANEKTLLVWGKREIEKKKGKTQILLGLILSDDKACCVELSEIIGFHLSARLLYQNMNFFIK